MDAGRLGPFQVVRHSTAQPEVRILVDGLWDEASPACAQLGKELFSSAWLQEIGEGDGKGWRGLHGGKG